MTRSSTLPRIVLIGAAGRMGRAIAFRFLTDKKVELVGAVDLSVGHDTIGHLSGAVELGPEIVKDVELLPQSLSADIVLDFSTPDAVRAHIEPCLSRGWDCIIGVTGFTLDDENNFHSLATNHGRKIVLVPNFCLGVNLMLKFAKDASRVFERVEIIELHHDKKADAPSGTAIHTAKLISEESERTAPPSPDDPSRGRIENNIPIHSVRLPGLLAHQEIIFGNPGEILTIRHDTTDRVAFLSGIYLAIEKLDKLEAGFIKGLDWALE
ncbi:MAG TPA: 4-hydroxy-tetrahydrodipicolinate reductase [Firmicutes bacterium]|nr:4-hydroxy-tetrahydrodipicolinate reductase [Bacillota bacterium]